MKSPADRTPRDYADLWVRGLPVIAAAAVGAVLAGWVAFALMPRTYESQARLLVTAIGPASVAAAQASDLAGRLRITSYEQLATSDLVLGRARQDASDELGDVDVATLRSRVTVVPTTNEAVLRINAEGPNAAAAQALASGISNHLAQAVNEIEWSNTDGAPLFAAEVIDAGRLPESPLRPQLWTTLLTALALGVVLSSLAVLALGLRRDLVLGPRDGVVGVR